MTTRQPPATLPELPIEPLSASAWQRVERRVFEQVRTPLTAAPAQAARISAWQIFGLAAASALTLLLTAVWWHSATDEDHYTTRDNTRVVRADGLELHLESASRVHRSGAVWTLEHGAAEFRVARRTQHKPLTVLAGDVRIEVIGTVFRVVHQGAAVQVETTEGTVRVIHAGHAQLIAAGERWPRTGHAPAGVAAQPHANNAAAEPAANDEPVIDQDTNDGRAQHKTKSAGRAERQRLRFERASALEARDVAEALRVYRGLAAESGVWAGNALFALARLEVELQLQAEAERDLRQYLSRYPRGPNASDARALLAVLRGEQPGWNRAP